MPRLRVLYVDDEADIREIVALSLGLDSDLWVCSCASGAEALAKAAEWSPDVILCDAVMPAMDGPATLVRLREHPRTVNTPFIFMTSRAQAREIEHLKSLGAIGIIVKPFDPMTLAVSVRSLLRVAGVMALDPARPIAGDLGRRSGSHAGNEPTPHLDRAATPP
jgi:CheY-like chemotaxis protein